MLKSPNNNPLSPPTKGPSIIDAIITGICIMVNFNGGIGINPIPVEPNIIVIANNIPVTAICLV